MFIGLPSSSCLLSKNKTTLGARPDGVARLPQPTILRGEGISFLAEGYAFLRPPVPRLQIRALEKLPLWQGIWKVFLGGTYEV